MKTYWYGLALGATLSVIIFLSNVVFPDNSPDSAPGMLLVLAVIGFYIVWASYHANRKSKHKNLALKVGAITSLIGFLMALTTFVIVDNLFLGIVSQQADKIMNFQRSQGLTMRQLVNGGLLHGFIFGTPASFLFGIVCGFIGDKL